jgi:hypothetical protein
MIAPSLLIATLASPWLVHAVERVEPAAPPPSDWGDFDDYEFEEDDESFPDAESNSEATTSPSSRAPTDATTKKSSPRGDTGIGGALRLVGAFSGFEDAAHDLGIEDDATLATVGRLLVDHRGDAIKIELNAFIELGRSGFSPALANAFGTAATNLSAYRHEYLTVPFWSQGNVNGAVGLDRARVAWEHRALLIEAGRFPISQSVTNFFTPNDFFAPFSANAINKIYKPGVEALRVSYAPTPLSALEFVAAPGFSDGYEAAWSHTALIVRASAVKWGYDWSVTGGKLAQRWVAGGAFQGTLGPVGMRAEGHLGIPDLDGKGRKGDDLDRELHGRAAGGPNFNFNWHSSAISLEYAFFSDGVGDPSDFVTRIGQRYPDDLPYMGRHYVAGHFSTQFIGVLSGAVLAMVNAEDGSGLAGLTLAYSVADEADLALGAFLPWGDGISAPSVQNPLPGVGSEFGASPTTVFLESRVFF